MTPDLITLTDPGSPVAEAYRRLRVNLSALARKHALHTVLVVAAGPDEQKAQTVANLAVSFARIGTRVILADCDLRRPTQHLVFGTENAVGVTTALAAPDAPLPLQPTAVANLQLLTSGPVTEAPADVLASPAMADLLGRLSAAADIVFLDAAPVTQATDAVELATRVDGVLLTVHAGHTKREDAQRATEQLTRVGANVLGAVLVNASDA